MDYEAAILNEAEMAICPDLCRSSDSDFCADCGDFIDHPAGPCDPRWMDAHKTGELD